MEHGMSMHQNLVESLTYLYEDILEIRLNTEQVTVWHCRQDPSLVEENLPYKKMMDLIGQNRIYFLDVDFFYGNVTMETLRKVAKRKVQQSFDIRFVQKEGAAFQWFEIRIVPAREDSVLVYTRNIGEEKQRDILHQAVIGDYDYIMYVDAAIDRYFIYTNENGRMSEPKKSGECYSEGLLHFSRQFLSESDQKRALQILSIENLRRQLREKEEIVYYGDVVVDQVRRNKKIRVICYDGGREIYLLTRSDITAAMEDERRKKDSVIEAFRTAEQASRAKDDFLAKISNDVRTPVSTIIGMAALAVTHLNDENRVVDSLHKISSAGRHLLKMVNQMLEVSQMGVCQKQEERFNLAEIMDFITRKVSGLVAEKQQDYVIHMQGIQHEEVYGNPENLGKACNNILINAIHFTPPHGKINVVLRELPSKITGYGYYELEVVDNGEGIEPEILERIFQPFIQKESRRKENEGSSGIGLGLTLAQNAIARMQGKIRIDSEPGEGTRVIAGFYLRLIEEGKENRTVYQGKTILFLTGSGEIPRYQNIWKQLEIMVDFAGNLMEAKRRIACLRLEKNRYFAVFATSGFQEGPEETFSCLKQELDTQEIPLVWILQQQDKYGQHELEQMGYARILYENTIQESSRRFLKELVQQQEEQEYMCTRALEQLHYEGCRVLLADSNGFNLEIMKEMLELTGATVDIVSNKADVLQRVEQSQEGEYDLVILEVSRQETDGYSAALEIRSLQRPDVKKMPIFALTSNLLLEEIVKMKQAGMDEYLLKPVSVKDMADKLQKWLGKGKQSRKG